MTPTNSPTQLSNLEVSITYLPGGGLCNQLVGVINTFAMAYATQTAVQLQPSAYRDSFNTTYQDMTWTTVDIDSILDIENMRHYWSKKGVHVNKDVNMTENNDHDGPVQHLVAEMKLHEQPARSLLSWANRVHAAALTRVADALEDHTYTTGRLSVTIDLGWPSERIAISSNPQVFVQLLNSVVFSGALEDIAKQILQELNLLAPSFNGIHLRIENDYVHHPSLDHQGTCDDSLHCLKSQYVPAMTRANLSQFYPLYIASAFFMTNPEQQQEVLEKLAPFGSQIVYKECLINVENLQNLHTEQLAAVDFIVMLMTSTFVGVVDSSFSKLVARFRENDGYAVETNVFAREFDVTRLDLS